jgi:hypothetical protein
LLEEEGAKEDDGRCIEDWGVCKFEEGEG